MNPKLPHRKYKKRSVLFPIRMDSILMAVVMVLIPFFSYAQKSMGFSIYSSELHEMVAIKNKAEWEQYRWELQRNMEEVMGPLPGFQDLPNLDMHIRDSLKTTKYLRLTIDFQAAKGERVSAYLYLPNRSSLSGKLPAMLALHPTGAEGKKIVDGQVRANRGYAKELAERGYIVIAPDYPSFGDLSDYDFSTARYQSGTMAGVFYHMRCVDLLLERGDVDPDRIGVIGHSLGGHNAMFVGAFDERLKVVVSSCGWTQFEYYDIGPVASERYGGRLGPFAQDRYMPLFRNKFELDGDRVPINYHEMIALLAPRGFFTNSPLNDANFELKGVVKGMEMAQVVYRYMGVNEKLQARYPEAEHDFPTATRREAYEFVDRLLEHNPNKHEIE